MNTSTFPDHLRVFASLLFKAFWLVTRHLSLVTLVNQRNPKSVDPALLAHAQLLAFQRFSFSVTQQSLAECLTL